METLHYSACESPFGRLMLVASERGLVYLQLPPAADGLAGLPKKLTDGTSLFAAGEQLRPYVQQLDEYFAGRRREFTFPLHLRGTEFQKRCWQALLAIPYGQTRTYAEQAVAVGCPGGFRAVGLANHDNPLAIVVPCHRVIASDGSLGGYGGGLEMKRKLLELEGARVVAQARLAIR